VRETAESGCCRRAPATAVPSEVPVVHHDDLHRQVVVGDGGQFPGSTSGSRPSPSRAKTRLPGFATCAPIAEGSPNPSTRVRPRKATAGVVEPDVLGSPHLVLPHVGADDRLPPGDAVDLPDQVLRLDLGVRHGRGERVLRHPAAIRSFHSLRAPAFRSFRAGASSRPPGSSFPARAGHPRRWECPPAGSCRSPPGRCPRGSPVRGGECVQPPRDAVVEPGAQCA